MLINCILPRMSTAQFVEMPVEHCLQLILRGHFRLQRATADANNNIIRS
jgi:hypothetical protein